MLIGYARESTDNQDTAAQVAALKAAGASACIVGRLPADAGTDPNFIGCWIISAVLALPAAANPV